LIAPTLLLAPDRFPHLQDYAPEFLLALLRFPDLPLGFAEFEFEAGSAAAPDSPALLVAAVWRRLGFLGSAGASAGTELFKSASADCTPDEFFCCQAVATANTLFLTA
jgi:hypothetical protein